MDTVQKSVLYENHCRLTDKSHLAAFAGYLMPMWYSSIREEHAAVRAGAGLFDCTHMGVLEILGPDAEGFLDIVTANSITKLTDGKAQYSCIFDESGQVLDDLIVYRRSGESFVLVVNAVNTAKIKSYLTGAPNQLSSYNFKPQLRDLRDLAQGEDCRVDLALQGPAAGEILAGLLSDEAHRRHLAELKPFGFMEATVAGLEVMLSRTGYTGAKVGYELYVHPERAGRLWERLLEHGRAWGLKPCGLGARDSLRTEAGLPLYGHELNGEYGISPYQAGYGWVIKLDKPFFVGQAAMRQKSSGYDMMVQRLEFPGQAGIRPIRQHDAVLDHDGKCVGWVLSCAKVDDRQIALGYLDARICQPGESIGLYLIARNARHIQQGRQENVQKGRQLTADLEGKVLERFARF